MDKKLVELLSKLFSRILHFLGVQNDTDLVFDGVITADKEFDFMKELGAPARYIKMETALDCAFQYRMRDHSKGKDGSLRAWPWVLTGGIPTNVLGENWSFIRVLYPGVNTRLRLYASTVLVTPSSAQSAR